MIRRIACGFYRTLTVCLLFVLLAVALKQAYPALGEKVGAWIAGAERSEAVQAIAAFFGRLTSGEGMKKAVEVFRETLQRAAGA
ncbi:MAG: hypothetical protein IJG45_06195 [Oscillospiraceae bacterium]|nr:hypothetical protein [Oscillospiraceae bacterium]